MIASFITALFFASSVVFAYQSSNYLGPIRANFYRLVVGATLLGIISFVFGIGLEGPGLGYFILSGFVGFGIGDVAMFLALPRLGSRLSILLVQCLAAPIAATTEWLWLGVSLSSLQLLCVVTILCGVALALVPAKHIDVQGHSFKFGTFWGFLAACGQAWGAVISRKAYQVSLESGLHVDGISAAFQRILGGVALAMVAFMVWKKFQSIEPRKLTPQEWRKSWSAIMLNALCGPVLGVSCYQWALSTTPSGIVLPIVAISPLLVIPFSYYFEGDKPTKRTLLGGVIAIAGVILLNKVH